jgi:hypothetical protein
MKYVRGATVANMAVAQLFHHQLRLLWGRIHYLTRHRDDCMNIETVSTLSHRTIPEWISFDQASYLSQM